MAYEPKVYRKQGGAKLVVADGGEIEIQSGGVISAAGTQASHITDAPGTATGNAVTINAILVVLESAGLTATS